MTHDEMIEVIRALKNGDPVEVHFGEWKEISVTEVHRPDFSRFTYRIKPAERKPREWLMYYSRNLGWQAQEFAPGEIRSPKKDFVHVREVIGE